MPKRKNESARIIKMAGLALVDAMIFQEVLASSEPKVATLSQVSAGHPVQQSLLSSWQYILQKNYAPIFELGIAILRAWPSSPHVEEALKILLAEAQKIASSRALLRHDLMGRIYHRLLLADVAKYYATYYTSVPAAWLLARLSLETENPAWNIDWSDAESASKFRVGDLACGSGTLLSASYRAILDKHVVASASKGQKPKLGELHKVLLENVLWGFDVLLYATHLAITGLSLHNPASVFDEANAYALPLTGKGDLRLGSIDFLVNRTIEVTSTLTGQSVGAERRGVESTEKVSVTLPDFDIIIMNPPFTRSVGGNLLFGALPKSERSKLQKKLQEILKEKNFSGIGQAGLGAVFIVTSDKYLKQNGRIAIVCPRSLISGVAWKKVRELLAKKYSVEYIIASHQAPDGWNFSENTDLSEVLVIAQKVDARKRRNEKTVIANFWRKPVNEIESTIIAEQLRGLKSISSNDLYNVIENLNASHFNLALGGRKLGEAYTVSTEAILSSQDTWGILTPFAQSELSKVAYMFVSSSQIYVPRKGVEGRLSLTKLSNIAEIIGPDRSQVHSLFTLSKSRTPYPTLWGYKSDTMKKIHQTHNAWLEPKAGMIQRANSLWKKSGRLMITESMRLNTYGIIASFLDSEALSNVWWPIKLKETMTSDKNKVNGREQEKISALWLNSTYGILGLLSYRQDTEGPWVEIKKATLGLIPMLDLTKVSRKQVDDLLSVFDKLCKTELPSLPVQFQEAADGTGIRKEIDQQMQEAVMKKPVDLKIIYEYLADEPIISLNPLPKM